MHANEGIEDLLADWKPESPAASDALPAMRARKLARALLEQQRQVQIVACSDKETPQQDIIEAPYVGTQLGASAGFCITHVAHAPAVQYKLIAVRSIEGIS